MTHEQFENAAQYWNKKEQVKMPKEALKSAIDAYVMENNTCALATGTGDYVRCTPIECSYRDSKFWMFSEGGEKIPLAALKKLEVPMNLICATPVKMEVLCSEFKKEGYSSRQTYEC